jgi:hypothetical protein
MSDFNGILMCVGNGLGARGKDDRSNYDNRK